MQKTLTLQVAPHIASHAPLLDEEIRAYLSLKKDAPLQYKILKRSIDARARAIQMNLSVLVAIDEELPRESFSFEYQDVLNSKRICHIIGAGPGGLFAALRCLELGIKPIVIERGKDVQSRRRDLAAINKEHIVNPESNYCFGEGGAGLFSDGKLITRIKSDHIPYVMQRLVQFGAPPEIEYLSNPHVGSDKIRRVIPKLREQILSLGGQIYFNTQVTKINFSNKSIY
mgnify:CR=1 FL=1